MSSSRRVALALAGMCAALVIAAPAPAATFNSGSTGADGAFAPPCASPPCTVTVALPASGVFNFSTINVAAGVTVQFTRNATNTPVTLLASGDVTVAGTISLDGQPGAAGSSSTSFANAGGAGGPGGFGGGAGSNATVTVSGGAGLGPGGGGTPTVAIQAGGGGGFGTAGVGFTGAGGPAYGNPQLLPLLGGSGGGGASASLGVTGGAGGAGGGALLLASSTMVTLTGTITAKGGAGGAGVSGSVFGGGGGAGGGVRLVATTLAGTGGAITATGGTPGLGAGTGGVGRIRLEAFTNTLTANVSGVAPSTGQPGVVFAAGLPGLSIASVGGVAAPAAPSGSYATPDVTLPSTATSPVAVVVNATNIPAGTPVVLRGKPQTGSANTTTTPGLSGGTASANLALDLAQPNVISAEATFLIAALDVPIKVAEAAGPADPVTQARVSAAFAGPSTVTYMTRAGREIAP